MCNCLAGNEKKDTMVKVPPLHEEEHKSQGDIIVSTHIEKKTPRGVNNPSQSIMREKKPSSSIFNVPQHSTNNVT